MNLLMDKTCSTCSTCMSSRDLEEYGNSCRVTVNTCAYYKKYYTFNFNTTDCKGVILHDAPPLSNEQIRHLIGYYEENE